jgi:hypothetical protein
MMSILALLLADNCCLIWLSGKRGHGHADVENSGIENADKNKKTLAWYRMVDGLPCNRFGLPEKFHVSFKY